MPDVLLGQAYHLRFDPKLWQARQPYAPLGTLYAAAYLRAQGHRPALYDAMLADSEAAWAAAVDRTRPDIAVIYEDSFNYLTKMCLLRMRQAGEAMIEHARKQGTRVFVSGSDATDHPDIYLRAGADAVVLGEGELTVAELVDVSRQGRGLDAVTGIAYQKPTGGIARTARRPFIRALDDLPRPAWDLVDVERYRKVWRTRHGYFAMNVATTRGCPYHCNWCAKPIYGQRYGVHAAERVVDEMAWLVRDYRPDQFTVVDDVFGLQPGWLDRFAALKQQAGLSTPFRCLMRADQIRRETVHALASSNCRMVWIGAESGSQRILDAMEKGIRVDEIRDAARQLRAAGIQFGLFLQFGYPGEHWADVQETLQLVRDVAPDDIGVSVSYPLPGTRFYERVRAELGRKQNWFDSNDLAMMYRASYPPEFYRVLHQVVHREFRSRRHARRLNDLLEHPRRFRAGDLTAVAAMIYQRSRLLLADRRLRGLAAAACLRPTLARVTPGLTRAAAATPSRQADVLPEREVDLSPAGAP